MYSRRQTFDAHLLPEISCNGRYVNYPATSFSKTGAMVAYFNNIQSLSPSNYCTDFRITYRFKVSCTPSASGKTFVFVKDINNCMRTLVTINGQISYESDGAAITPIYKTYSKKYKSVDNLNYNDIYTYEAGTSFTTTLTGTNQRGVQSTGTTAGHFYVNTTVPILNELLVNGLGG